MMYGYGTDMTWWMVLYSILWFALIALAIVGIVVWLRNSLASAPESGARRILEERLARGEIDDEEFRRRLKVLS